MKAKTTFIHNGATLNIRTTDKCHDIEAFHIRGVRWFQKTYGNTYHRAYISALVNGRWVELGHTDIDYGYGDHYKVTAGAWLIENGYFECDNKAGYAFADYSVRDTFAVEYTSQDVQRKRDL